MDSSVERYEKEKRDRLRFITQNALARAEQEPDFKGQTRVLKLKMKKPTLKELIGENPLSNEEFDELEKYFRMRMEKA